MPIRSPILQSCCWSSVKRGCYVSGLYSIFYFTVTTLVMSQFIQEQGLFLMGNNTSIDTFSFLEPESISYPTMIFSIALLVCSVSGVLATIILLVGLSLNRKCYLLPWIFVMGMDTFLEIIHCGYLFVLETVDFNPVTAVLFTCDFFVIIIHVYALLCVVSQFQMYKMGGNSSNHEHIISFSQVTSTESRNVPTSTFSTQRTLDGASLNTHYSSIVTQDSPSKASSLKKPGKQVSRGVSFAEDVFLEAQVLPTQ